MARTQGKFGNPPTVRGNMQQKTRPGGGAAPPMGKMKTPPIKKVPNTVKKMPAKMNKQPNVGK